jgi:hypothetical protein
VEGVTLLTAIASLALAIAGFAGVVTAFGQERWAGYESFRVRVLVATGLSVAIGKERCA